MKSDTAISRRVFLARAAGMTLTLGGEALWRPAAASARRRPPYTGGLWLAGDHHIHTRYSDDGQYLIQQQVANAARFGLGWCVITDHGGPNHDKVALAQAYPDLLAARRENPQIIVFQGLEWNIPAAEHGSVILPPTREEAQRISAFESHYDESHLPKDTPEAALEADAVAGVKYLESLTPRPLFIANHPARRGVDSPHEMRAWADAGPDVTRGFEGAPGHQAATLTGGLRGEYNTNKPGAHAWPGYPPESYRTFGGYDWYVATVGGLWDSLLAEGRPWYITADSDSHRHWDDRTIVDESTYLTQGHVTPTDRKADNNTNVDFYPGEYSKTWVYVARREPLAILDAMRAGNMFTVLGGLIDRLELSAYGGNNAAPMGGTLRLDRAGEDVNVTIRVRVPRRPNFGGRLPRLHHIDLIAGDILGPAANRDAQTNPTTQVVARLPALEASREGETLAFSHRFPQVRHDFYVRVRGTSTEVDSPHLDSPSVDPWNDLWFYSNPIMVRLPST
jgi:hypothetical protein